ncbi:MAG TPA: SpoIIE family protein phosphatase, partial [Bacteroidia bacterium]|nr:SpoIIE family protein phosphatase [Bacteroidia bacterium]
NEEGVSIHLTIVPPFWKTWWFQASVFIFIVLSVYGYVKRRINRLRKNEILLEKQVLLKTKELRDEKEIVENQNQVIEKKNHNITSSIRYAKRIQESILPIKEKLNELIPESFIFFKPKDIVSGDFYWFAKQKNKILVAAVDCTGHGVPGAFMSLIGNNLLNDIVKNHKILDPAKILYKVHEGLVDALKKGEQESDTVDGMDITLCVIDLEKKLLEFSSTGRPLIHIRENVVQKFRVGKHPLGLITKKEIKLENEKIQLLEGDTFYIFTDGYCDQFGGEEDNKYLDDNFEKLLLKIQNQTMPEQAVCIENEINVWKGNGPQIDDMLVIGVRC